MLVRLENTISKINFNSITEERKEVLNVLIKYIQEKVNDKKPIALNFICTHNSRRSQFAQVWAKVASSYYDIEIDSYSGGVEVTAFNERAVASLDRFGFEITKKGEGNPKYLLKYIENESPILAFSKLFNDAVNPIKDFAAVMTCGHADENCPLIDGCEERISLRYEDPKAFDDTPKESEMYDERSIQIATELFYVFSQIKN